MENGRQHFNRNICRWGMDIPWKSCSGTTVADSETHRNVKRVYSTFGIYYFYVLSGGNHPFGRGVDEQMVGISNEKKSNLWRDMGWGGGQNWHNILFNKKVSSSYIYLLFFYFLCLLMTVYNRIQYHCTVPIYLQSNPFSLFQLDRTLIIIYRTVLVWNRRLSDCSIQRSGSWPYTKL